MHTLSCENCGSVKFHKENNTYICQHCGTRLIPKVIGISNNRKKVLTILLLLLLIGVFLIYKLLYRVDENIKNIKNNSQPTQVFNVEIKDSSNDVDTPFSTLNANIKEKLQKELGSFPIEEALRKYNQEPREKAFFISLNKKGQYSYGYSGGLGSIQEATKQAFSICEKERKTRQLKEVCIPYIINMHVSETLTD